MNGSSSSTTCAGPDPGARRPATCSVLQAGGPMGKRQLCSGNGSGDRMSSRMKGSAGQMASAALAVLVVSASAFAQSLSAPDPRGERFVPERLARIAPWFQGRIDEGAFPGAVVGLLGDGKVAYLEAIGTQDRARTAPMKTDSIFWIASMTKPVTSVAAMMLVD